MALRSAPSGEGLAPLADVRLWQADAREWPVDAGDAWLDAATIYAHLRDNTNQVAAATAFPWGQVISPAARVLDLGCGAGWLTSFLSSRDDVAEVIAWDSSSRLLNEVLPPMVDLLDGDLGKIERVCGEFAPLRLDDRSVDVVVMASAFHHASDPDRLLTELHRILRPGGCVVLLNEVPYSVPSMLRFVLTTAVAAAVQAVSASAPVVKQGWVAAEEVLYDPELGDRGRTRAQWSRLFARHPYRVEVVRTPLPPYPPAFRKQPALAQPLTHFVLTPTTG